MTDFGDGIVGMANGGGNIADVNVGKLTELRKVIPNNTVDFLLIDIKVL